MSHLEKIIQILLLNDPSLQTYFGPSATNNIKKLLNKLPVQYYEITTYTSDCLHNYLSFQNNTDSSSSLPSSSLSLEKTSEQNIISKNRFDILLIPMFDKDKTPSSISEIDNNRILIKKFMEQGGHVIDIAGNYISYLLEQTEDYYNIDNIEDDWNDNNSWKYGAWGDSKKLQKGNKMIEACKGNIFNDGPQNLPALWLIAGFFPKTVPILERIYQGLLNDRGGASGDIDLVWVASKIWGLGRLTYFGYSWGGSSLAQSESSTEWDLLLELVLLENLKKYNILRSKLIEEALLWFIKDLRQIIIEYDQIPINGYVK